MVLLAVRMVAEVTETRYVIPSLSFKAFTVLSHIEHEFLVHALCHP